MTREEMLRQLEAILERVPQSLQGAEKLSDLPGWDSLAILNFIAAADRSCGIRLKADHILAAATVNDLLALLKL